jgi:hypothetical protein
MASPDSFRKDFTHLPILLFQRNEGMAKGSVVWAFWLDPDKQILAP